MQRPSLLVLDALYQYDDFMSSISTLVDIGCGAGEDLEWWATRTTRDDVAEPLNIKCTGVDRTQSLAITKKYSNIFFQQADFEQQIMVSAQHKFDVLWCFDAFQYAINPLATLAKWRDLSTQGAMLALSVPQTTNFVQRQSAFTQPSGVYYHYTLVNIIHMLAISGWDCRSGFFYKSQQDPWIHAVVYKSSHEPMCPQTTTWYELMEKKLLPDSADVSVNAHGYLRQQDLVLPWIDKSLQVMSRV